MIVDPVARRQMIDEALRAGFTYAEVGRSLGYSREWVRQIVVREGIEPSRLAWSVCEERAAAKKAMSAARAAKRAAKYQPIVEAVLAGESIGSAAKRHGVSPTSAFSYLKAHGVRSTHKSMNPRYR